MLWKILKQWTWRRRGKVRLCPVPWLLYSWRGCTSPTHLAPWQTVWAVPRYLCTVFISFCSLMFRYIQYFHAKQLPSLSLHPASSPSRTRRAAVRGSDSLCVHHPNLHPFIFILNSGGKMMTSTPSLALITWFCTWKFSELSVCALQQLQQKIKRSRLLLPSTYFFSFCFNHQLGHHINQQIEEQHNRQQLGNKSSPPVNYYTDIFSAVIVMYGTSGSVVRRPFQVKA